MITGAWSPIPIDGLGFRHVYVAVGQPYTLPAGPLMVTIEPWCGIDQVLKGTHDEWLADLASRTRQTMMYVRFAHEQNANWYPWAVSKTGEEPWRNAWFHVTSGMPGRKVWCPNVEFAGSGPFWAGWPGSQGVDVVGLDGYDWNGKTSASAVFGPSLGVARQQGKPVMVAETATWRRQAAWIADLGLWAKASRLEAVAWFSETKERDWALGSQGLAAFRRLR